MILRLVRLHTCHFLSCMKSFKNSGKIKGMQTVPSTLHTSVLHVHEEVASGLVVVTWGISSDMETIILTYNFPDFHFSENTNSQNPAVLQEQCGKGTDVHVSHLLDSHRFSTGQVANGKDLGHYRRTLVRLGNIGILLMLHHSWPQVSGSHQGNYSAPRPHNEYLSIMNL